MREIEFDVVSMPARMKVLSTRAQMLCGAKAGYDSTSDLRRLGEDLLIRHLLLLFRGHIRLNCTSQPSASAIAASFWRSKDTHGRCS